jgi:hypothetical protein
LDAVLDKSPAINHAELGRYDIALELIGRAEAELAGDPKLAVTLDACALVSDVTNASPHRSCPRRSRHSSTWACFPHAS